MKNSKIYVTLLIGCLIAIISCNKKADEVNPSDPTIPEEKPKVKITKPGQFGLAQMTTNQRIHKQEINGITYVPSETLQKTNRNQRTNNNVSFDLGNLKASKSFYFILSNSGDTSITNITIESNNANFEVFPKSIDKLEPAGQSNIVPLLELGVIHGNRLNGVGFQSLLPMGDNTVKVTIKGKTIGENGEEDVTLEADIKLFAEVMDVEFYLNDIKVDLTNISLISNVGAGDDSNGLSGIRHYSAGKNDVLTFKNVGNVDVGVKYYNGLSNTKDSRSVSLLKGETLGLDITHQVTIFALDGNGVIADVKKLQMGSNGKAYLGFQFNQ